MKKRLWLKIQYRDNRCLGGDSVTIIISFAQLTHVHNQVFANKASTSYLYGKLDYLSSGLAKLVWLIPLHLLQSNSGQRNVQNI